MKKSRRDPIVLLSSMLSPEARAARESLAKLSPRPIPPSARECFAQRLLAYGLPHGRRAMSPTHQLDLVQRHPGLYRRADDRPVSSCTPFAREGFACGDGWFGIIDRLSGKLAADPNLVVSQLKEKMGLLTVYFEPGEPASSEIEAATDRALEEARAESGQTCEICGEPGEIAARLRGWISVRCVPCESLDDMEEACRRLAKYAGSRELEAFAADGQTVDASMLALVHLGEGAASQSAERRARFPGVDWSRLESFRAITGITGAPSMTAAEIWTFARDVAPALLRALR